MGRIYDALRRAEEERRRAATPGAVEPALVVDAETTTAPEPAVTAPGTGRLPVSGAADGWGAARDAAPPPADLVVLAAPSSPPAEHLRAIRARILQAFEEHGCRSMLVTSAGRGDGKSTTAANLTLLLAAEINKRALLVDADLRKPAVDRLLQVAPGPGLAEVALGRAAWREVVRPAPWNGLAVLPAGSRIPNVTETLNGPMSRAFFHDVKSAYDFVVIDAPPVLPVADAVGLAGQVDAVLLVARGGLTPRGALVDAVEALSRARLLGVVLNAVQGGWSYPHGYRSY